MPRLRKLSAYNKFVHKEMRSGASMSEAAAAWRSCKSRRSSSRRSSSRRSRRRSRSHCRSRRSRRSRKH